MNKSDFMIYARQLVADYFNEHADPTSGMKLTLNDVLEDFAELESAGEHYRG